MTPHPSRVAKTAPAAHWTRWSFCKNHRNKTLSIGVCSILQKPAVALQSEEWIQDLERKKKETAVIWRKCNRQHFLTWMAKPFPATRLATPPEKRIKRLRLVVVVGTGFGRVVSCLV